MCLIDFYDFDMTIEEICSEQCYPFELENIKLVKLFSFFLHCAPTINSRTAANIDDERLNANWNKYISNFSKDTYCFLAPNSGIDKHLKRHHLLYDCNVNRKTKAIVCKRKNNKEKEYVCILRHIRNSIAHNNVFLKDVGNRKFIVFKDYNDKNILTAIILFSQTDLSRLKKQIMN